MLDEQLKARLMDQLSEAADKAVNGLEGAWNDPDMVEDMYEYFSDHAFEAFKEYAQALTRKRVIGGNK